MIKCEHCDAVAHYRLTIEDFNSAEVYSAGLCIKCIGIEELKTVGGFPVTKSLKIEPLLAALAGSVSNKQQQKRHSLGQHLVLVSEPAGVGFMPSNSRPS